MTPMAGGPASPTDPPPSGCFHLLAKPTGAQCDVDCAYHPSPPAVGA